MNLTLSQYMIAEEQQRSLSGDDWKRSLKDVRARRNAAYARIMLTIARVAMLKVLNAKISCAN